MRGRLHLLLIPVAATLAVLPLLLNGCSCGHDFDFHLISWLEAARQFSAGNLHPHWAFNPAFGAGEPRFVFYPPLSWTIGALLTLLLQHLPHLSPDRAFSLAPIFFTWIALCAAGLAMHALARRFTNPAAAILAATFYLANPYTLFTAYERTAFAELLAAAWIPLLLLAVLPPGPDSHAAPQSRPSIPLLASAVALLWLTNAPAAVMGCYTLAVIAILRLAHLYRAHRSLTPLLRPARDLVAGTLLGLALAAFYIAPAAYERRWVEIDMATIPGMRIADNTLFHHTGDAPHDAVVHTASVLAILLLSLTAAALIRTWLTARNPARRPPAQASNLRILLVLTLSIAFLLTPLSLPLWHHAPELAFLQFPWRILAVLAALLALAIALALDTPRLRSAPAIAISLILPAALIFAAYRQFQQPCDDPDTPPAQLALFHSTAGTDPTDEYTPVPDDNDALHPGNPPLRLDPPSPGSPLPASPGPAPAHFDLDLTAPHQLILNLRNYPAWRIDRNGSPITDSIPRDDGLIAVSLPAGHSHIDLIYATTTDGHVGDAISLLALCLFLPTVLLNSRRKARDLSRNPPPTP